MGVLTGIKGTRQGWVRQIRANDAYDALYITQTGGGNSVHIIAPNIAFAPPIAAGHRWGLFIETAWNNNNHLAMNRDIGELACFLLYGYAGVGGEAYSRDNPVYIASSTADALRLRTGDINPSTYGGFKVAYLFSVANLAANLINVDLEVAGGNGAVSLVLPYAGSVLAISVYGNDVCTAETATFEPVINLAECTQDAVISIANPQTVWATAAKDTAGNTFAAGAQLYCHVTTTAGFLPAGTTDYVVCIVVEF